MEWFTEKSTKEQKAQYMEREGETQPYKILPLLTQKNPEVLDQNLKRRCKIRAWNRIHSTI